MIFFDKMTMMESVVGIYLT